MAVFLEFEDDASVLSAVFEHAIDGVTEFFGKTGDFAVASVQWGLFGFGLVSGSFQLFTSIQALPEEREANTLSGFDPPWID